MQYDARAPVPSEASPAIYFDSVRARIATCDVTALYMASHDRFWSNYPDSPATLVGIGGCAPLAPTSTRGWGVDRFPLTRSLAAPAGSLVTVRIRVVFEPAAVGQGRIARFEPVGAPTRVLDLAPVRALVSVFHQRFHARLHDLAERFTGPLHARPTTLPPFDPAAVFEATFDARSRRLYLATHAREPHGMHLIATYRLRPPYRSIDAVSLWQAFEGR